MTLSSVQTASLEKIVEEYQRTFNARDFDALVKLLDPEVEVEVDAGIWRGVDAARAQMEQADERYPGVRYQTERVVAAGTDSLVVEGRAVNPDPAPSEERAWALEGRMCTVFEFRQGRIARLRSYYAPSPDDRSGHANVPLRAEGARIAEEQAA
jgi:ketosteroid isomerase-like protein